MKTEAFDLGKEIRNTSTLADGWPSPDGRPSDLECSHCGEPCDSHQLKYAGKYFCCAGCRSVFSIIEQHGLCEYYDREDVSKVMRKATARDTDNDRYVALNDTSVEARLLSFASASRNRVVWTIPTLHCASCVWLLEQINRLDTGIMSSTVDVMRKTVTIDFDPHTTSLASIASTLASIGYAPLIRTESTDNNSAQSATRAADASRALYARIGLAAFAMANTMLMAIAQYLAGYGTISTELRTAFNWIAILLSIPVLIYSASPWFTAAGAALRQRRISLDVPVAMGILALFVRSIVDIVQGTGEGYLDSFNALVMLLLIGRLFQQKAFDALSFDRTYRSFFPLSVRVRRDETEADGRPSADGGPSVVLPIEQIGIGDLLSIRNGEVIPCDCTLESEVGYIDYSFVTGESMPVEALKGQIVHAGGRVVGRALSLHAVKEVSHSELANMWDRSSKRSSRKTFITLSDSFGRWFTVFAVVFAVSGALIWLPDWTMAFNVFTAVLIIACPCALTLAAPITLGTAMGRLGELGIYLKNIGTLLDLQRINAVYFDKTGTLTEATHELEYQGQKLTADEWQALQSVAAQSAHPISRSIVQMVGAKAAHVWNLVEFTGKGISGTANNERIALGSLPFVVSRLEYTPDLATISRLNDSGTTHLAINGEYVGAFAMKSTLRPGITAMVRKLTGLGNDVQVVTGDTDRDRALLLPFIGGESLKFNCKPEAKIAHVEVARAEGKHVLMVGDGLNDAGAMGAAEVAIAVTEETATLVPACDVIMRSHALQALPELIDYARRVKRIVIVSFLISIAYNAVGLTLAIMGLLSPLMAAILMPVSSLTVIEVSVFGARLKISAFCTHLTLGQG